MELYLWISSTYHELVILTVTHQSCGYDVWELLCCMYENYEVQKVQVTNGQVRYYGCEGAESVSQYKVCYWQLNILTFQFLQSCLNFCEFFNISFVDIAFQEHMMYRAVPADIILFTVNLFLYVLRQWTFGFHKNAGNLPSGRTTCGLSSGTQLHIVSYVLRHLWTT
jgi:hypothetical protein